MSAFDPKRTSNSRVPAVQATMGGTEPYVAMLGRDMTAGEEESVSGKSGWQTSKLPRHAMNSRTLIPLRASTAADRQPDARSLRTPPWGSGTPN